MSTSHHRIIAGFHGNGDTAGDDASSPRKGIIWGPLDIRVWFQAPCPEQKAGGGAGLHVGTHPPTCLFLAESWGPTGKAGWARSRDRHRAPWSGEGVVSTPAGPSLHLVIVSSPAGHRCGLRGRGSVKASSLRLGVGARMSGEAALTDGPRAGGTDPWREAHAARRQARPRFRTQCALDAASGKARAGAHGHERPHASGMRVTAEPPAPAPHSCASRPSSCRPGVGFTPGSRTGGLRPGDPAERPRRGGPKAAPDFGCHVAAPVAPHPEPACGRRFWERPPPGLRAASRRPQPPTPSEGPQRFPRVPGALVRLAPLLPSPSPFINPAPPPLHTHRARVLELALPPHLGRPGSHWLSLICRGGAGSGEGATVTVGGLMSSSLTPAPDLPCSALPC